MNKIIKDDSTTHWSQNLLELDYSGSDLTIFFTGKPECCHLLTIRDLGVIRAMREYLKDYHFQNLKTLNNCLDFDEIELVLIETHTSCGDRVEILFKENLPKTFLKKKIIYSPGDKDIILFKILTNQNSAFRIQHEKQDFMR